ncbi:hypothetical protein LINPERHAP1_LOCUS4247 [Linum perenne]
MATNIFNLRTVVVLPYAVSDPDQANRRRNSSSSSSSSTAISPKWWSPLFGWSSEPDYVGTDNPDKDLILSRSEADLARSRFSPGCFTAEKAKQLRMMTSDGSSHHDAMYHSAIASRLASDFKHSSTGDR